MRNKGGSIFREGNVRFPNAEESNIFMLELFSKNQCCLY